MSLSEAIADIADTAPTETGTRCKAGRLIAGLNDEDAATFATWVAQRADTRHTSSHVSSAVMAQALERNTGIRVSTKLLNAHAARMCGCYSAA